MIIQLTNGLKVIIDYSFHVPEQFGVATPETANCCPYGRLPDNDTQLMVPPTVIGIGTQKGGTTTLYEQLTSHPQMYGTTTKELHYLDSAGKVAYAAYLSQWRWNRDGPRALILLDGELAEKVIPPPGGHLFEISPSYMFVPFAACKAKVISPNAKIIVFLRDPVDRAYSAFSYMSLVVYKNQKRVTDWMRNSFWSNVRRGILDIEKEAACDFQTGRGLYSYNDCVGCMLRWTKVQGSCGYRPFVTLIDEESHFQCNSAGKEMLLRGLYGPQLAWWFTLMDPSQFMIINSADYFEHPLAVMKRVGRFLGLHTSYTSQMLDSSDKKANVGHYRRENKHLVKHAKSILREFYRRPNLELYRLLYEAGHTDFRPFETHLQERDILDCSDTQVAATGVCGDLRFLQPDSENEASKDRLPQKVMQVVHPARKGESNVNASSLFKRLSKHNKETLQPETLEIASHSTGHHPHDVTEAAPTKEPLSRVKVVLEPNAVLYSTSTQLSLTVADGYMHVIFGLILTGFLVYGAFLGRTHLTRTQT